jgi:hypothetical protein
LDSKRFKCGAYQMEELENQLKAGTLVMRRIPLNEIVPTLHPVLQHFHDRWVQRREMGKDSLNVLRYGLWWLQQHVVVPETICDEVDFPIAVQKGSLWTTDGRLAVSLGRPFLMAALELAGKVEDKKVCLIPAWKARQPNELLEFAPGTPSDVNVRQNILRRMTNR